MEDAGVIRWTVYLDIRQARLALAAVKEMRDCFGPDDPGWRDWFELQLHLEQFLKPHDEAEKARDPA